MNLFILKQDAEKIRLALQAIRGARGRALAELSAISTRADEVDEALRHITIRIQDEERATVQATPAPVANKFVYKVVHVNGRVYESVVATNKLIYRLGSVTTGDFMAAFATIKDARKFQAAHSGCVVLKCEASPSTGVPAWWPGNAHGPAGTVFCKTVKPIQLMN